MNDDADDTTLSSKVTHALPAGGASYERHNFVVDVAPLAIEPSSCGVGWDVNDEPPVAVSRLESLFDSYLGWYKLSDGREPECLDFGDPEVRAAVAADIAAHSGNWDSTPSVVRAGAAGFLEALAAAKQDAVTYADSSEPKEEVFEAAYPFLDADARAVTGDARTNASAYLEFRLSLDAAPGPANFRSLTRGNSFTRLRPS